MKNWKKQFREKFCIKCEGDLITDVRNVEEVEIFIEKLLKKQKRKMKANFEEYLAYFSQVKAKPTKEQLDNLIELLKKE